MAEIGRVLDGAAEVDSCTLIISRFRCSFHSLALTYIWEGGTSPKQPCVIFSLCQEIDLKADCDHLIPPYFIKPLFWTKTGTDWIHLRSMKVLRFIANAPSYTKRENAWQRRGFSLLFWAVAILILIALARSCIWIRLKKIVGEKGNEVGRRKYGRRKCL